METNKQDKVINLNLINISPRLGKLNEHHWIGFAVFIFAITWVSLCSLRKGLTWFDMYQEFITQVADN